MPISASRAVDWGPRFLSPPTPVECNLMKLIFLWSTFFFTHYTPSISLEQRLFFLSFFSFGAREAAPVVRSVDCINFVLLPNEVLENCGSLRARSQVPRRILLLIRCPCSSAEQGTSAGGPFTWPGI